MSHAKKQSGGTGQINQIQSMALFVGILSLKDDPEIMKQQISLSRLRFLLIDCLQLHPFLGLIEEQLVTEIKKEEDHNPQSSVSNRQNSSLMTAASKRLSQQKSRQQLEIQDNSKSKQSPNVKNQENNTKKWSFNYDFSTKESNLLSSLDQDACDKFRIDISMIDTVLSSHELFVRIPNYVNGKSTNVNINLIRTSLAILMKGYLNYQQIHEIMIAFETKVKEMGTDKNLPLSEKIIGEALRPIGLSIPLSMLHMWCKKCWNYLDCAAIEQQKKQNKQKHKPVILAQMQPAKKNTSDLQKGLSGGLNTSKNNALNTTTVSGSSALGEGNTVQSSKPASRGRSAVGSVLKVDPIAEEFKNLYLFPHEFLCLVCNAKDRIEMLDNAYQLDFKLTKTCYKNKFQPSKHQIDSNCFQTYDMIKSNIGGDWRDWRPNKILDAELEDDFYDQIPINDDGLAQTNKRAGINPTKKSRALNISKTQKEKTLGMNADDYKRTGLKEQIGICRGYSKQMTQEKALYLAGIHQKQKEIMQEKMRKQARRSQNNSHSRSKSRSRSKFAGMTSGNAGNLKIPSPFATQQGVTGSDVASIGAETSIAMSGVISNFKRNQDQGEHTIGDSIGMTISIHEGEGEITKDEFSEEDSRTNEGSKDEPDIIEKESTDEIYENGKLMNPKSKSEVLAAQYALKNQAARLGTKLNLNKDRMSQMLSEYKEQELKFAPNKMALSKSQQKNRYTNSVQNSTRAGTDSKPLSRQNTRSRKGPLTRDYNDSFGRTLIVKNKSHSNIHNKRMITSEVMRFMSMQQHQANILQRLHRIDNDSPVSTIAYEHQPESHSILINKPQCAVAYGGHLLLQQGNTQHLNNNPTKQEMHSNHLDPKSSIFSRLKLRRDVYQNNFQDQGLIKISQFTQNNQQQPLMPLGYNDYSSANQRPKTQGQAIRNFYRVEAPKGQRHSNRFGHNINVHENNNEPHTPQEMQGLKYVKPNYIHKQEGVAVSSSNSKSKLSGRNDYQNLTSLSGIQQNNFGINEKHLFNNINKKPGNFFNNSGRVVLGKRNAVSNTRSSSRGSARNGLNMFNTENAPQNNESNYIVTVKGPIEGFM